MFVVEWVWVGRKQQRHLSPSLSEGGAVCPWRSWRGKLLLHGEQFSPHPPGQSYRGSSGVTPAPLKTSAFWPGTGSSGTTGYFKVLVLKRWTGGPPSMMWGGGPLIQLLMKYLLFLSHHSSLTPPLMLQGNFSPVKILWFWYCSTMYRRIHKKWNIIVIEWLLHFILENIIYR